MNKISIFTLVAIVYLLVEIEALPTFWDDVKSGWDKFLSAIRRPVKVRKLGKQGKLKTTTTTPTPNTTTTETITVSTSATIETSPIQRASESSTAMIVTDSSTWKPLPPQEPTDFDMKEIETSSFPMKQDIMSSSVDQNRLYIPLITVPTWQSVYHWNNLQKPPNYHLKKNDERDSSIRVFS